MNRLVNEKSPYLRHAATQPVDWYPWCDEAFERAQAENKPLFLSSGGVWCHWCHVMATDNFEDPETARILNERFISVKLDRDERPDIDRRYQHAVAAMGGGSGWPLSVFLTPDRIPFYGGTYFPPEDRQGRPGFRKVLLLVSELFARKPGDAANYGARVWEAVAPASPEPGELAADAVERFAAAALGAFDATNGGFGDRPKFPMPGVLDFLLHAGSAEQGDRMRRAAFQTLDHMARGGMHDQLAGGFHRYSVDEAWFIPHFEKMADDNAWLLRNYLDAYAISGDGLYAEVSRGIIRFVRTVLSDPAGGFYAGQDADVTPDDEGGYFIWTEDEFRRLLDEDEYRVCSLRFFHKRGRAEHAAGAYVLCRAREEDAIASALGVSRNRVRDVLERGREKLLAARKKRETPFIDRTLYTSLNGMLVTSFLLAYRRLGDRDAADFALRSLDRILQERVVDGKLFHTAGIDALLDDYVYLVEALIAAYEAAGDGKRLDLAVDFMHQCLDRFGDPAGGFFDTAGPVLGMRLKGIEDVPHPSPNAVAATTLIRLHHITGVERFRREAEKVLRLFSRRAVELGVHAGYFHAALDAWFSLVKLTVEASPESDLARAARAIAPSRTVIAYGRDQGRVIPCRNRTCCEPVSSPAELPRAVAGLAG